MRLPNVTTGKSLIGLTKILTDDTAVNPSLKKEKKRRQENQLKNDDIKTGIKLEIKTGARRKGVKINGKRIGKIINMCRKR